MAGKKNRNKKESILPVLVTLIFLASAGVGLFKCIVRPPEAPPPRPAATEGEKHEDTASVPAPQRKEYCYTILLSGLDDDNGGSDTNIVMRFDASNDTIDLVSLPRDTLLHHDWRSNKLNFAYAKGGTELLRSEISNLLGIPVDFYVTVNLKAFSQLVDAIGGVNFDVPVNMDYDDPYQDLHIHFNAGYQYLNGEQALQVLRWRKNNDGTGYATRDIGRINTQQAFLKTVAAQLLQPANVTKVGALADIFSSNVKTDLTSGNLVWLGTETFRIGMDNIHFYTLPGDGSGWYRGESVYALNAEETLALVNSALNPYLEPRTMDDLDILIP